MAESPAQQQEALFRPGKRRKVFRKRVAEDDQDAKERQGSPAELTGSGAVANAAQEDSNHLLPVVRRPAAKKHGISFSSSNVPNQGAASQLTSIETALVPVIEQDAGNALQGDRFTKPTGNVGVVEDKHLTAYVDSKLAELRSSSATPLAQGDRSVASNRGIDELSSTRDADTDEHASAEATTAKQGFEGSRRGHPYGSQTRSRRPRRQPYVRDASDIARDAMVDAIMKESQVPLYDQSTSAAASTDTASADIDNDEAAAEAFKVQFLEDLEQRKRRKPPAPPAAGQVSSGPKLGGSRSQREKMRALEEAKNAVGKK